MCGIIGFCGPNDQQSRKLLANLIFESSYRGKHSTGLCWKDKADEFGMAFLDYTPSELELFLELQFHDLNQINALAHTRYCTSHPDYPLPLIDEGRAIVLNGVISQEPQDLWPTYGLPAYGGHNDAEIMLRLVSLGRVEETPGSYAACFMGDHGTIVGVRSPERPLWWHAYQWETEEDEVAATAYVFTSTLNIAHRADPELNRRSSRELQPGVVVCLNNATEVSRFATEQDLQCPKTKPVKPCKI